MTAIGAALRTHRAGRGMTQQDLAFEAELSTRHLSFIETGRAQPSAEMVERLARALRLGARERNTLRQAAGFAPKRAAVDLGDPSMAEMRQALKLILQRQEPFGAVVFDRHWDILMVNRGFRAFLGDDALPAPYRVAPTPRPNWLRLLLGPGTLRERILNWPEVAGAVRARVLREQPELLKGFDVTPAATDGVIIPIRLRLGKKQLRLFSTVTSLGTAQDVMLQELRIDAFHPFDVETARLLGQ